MMPGQYRFEAYPLESKYPFLQVRGGQQGPVLGSLPDGVNYLSGLPICCRGFCETVL